MTDEEILQLARDRFKIAEDAEAQHRRDAIDDLRFRAGEQWPEDIKNARALDGRPCLTINRLPQFLRQVTNEQRQNRPSIKISPVDSEGDIDTAEVIQGLVRHIEVDSGADAAYDTAFEASCTHGRGYWRVLTEYSDDMSFEQDIKIKRIRNPFAVYVDPAASEPDYSDMEWAFIIQEVPREIFEQQWPSAVPGPMEEWTAEGDDWVTRELVRVAEYFYVERTRKTLVEYAVTVAPDISTQQAIGTGYKDDIERQLGSRAKILRERTVWVPSVKWCKTNGHTILEKTEWPGRWIPIVPILGDELEIEGEIRLSGIVRDAKDAQRQYNFWATAETETIALAPRAPYIVAEGQLEGHINEWKTANVRNHAYLSYKPTDVGGNLVPPPQRNVYEPPVQAMVQARQQSSEDLKATTGIYDASLGARSNETSGRAIEARKLEGDVANFHYIDNLSRALRHTGRILIDLIPKIIDTARAVRIIGEDGSERSVMLNQPFFNPETQKEELYDIRVGKYDVRVDTGPSYQTKRQHAVEAQTQIVQAVPDAMGVIGDLMLANMDIPQAQEMSERWKRTIPPQLLGDDDGEADTAQMQAALQEAQTKLEALNKYAEESEQKLQQIQQDNAILRAGLELKKEDLVLKSREVDLKREELAHKRTIETRELALKEEELALKAVAGGQNGNRPEAG